MRRAFAPGEDPPLPLRGCRDVGGRKKGRRDFGIVFFRGRA